MANKYWVDKYGMMRVHGEDTWGLTAIEACEELNKLEEENHRLKCELDEMKKSAESYEMLYCKELEKKGWMSKDER